MGEKFLIDTNILIEFQAKKLPAIGQVFVANTIDEEFNISIINSPYAKISNFVIKKNI